MSEDSLAEREKTRYAVLKAIFDLTEGAGLNPSNTTLTLDLLRKSAFEVGVSKGSDEVESESEASTAVSVSFFEDAPDFQRADDVFDSYTEAS